MEWRYGGGSCGEEGEAEIPAVAGEEGATRHYCGRCDGGDDGKA